MSPQPGNWRRNGNKFPIRKPAELERIHRAYVDNELALHEICRRFKMSAHELNVIRDREGWKPRGQASKPRISSHRKLLPKRRTEAQVRQANLADVQARETALYGPDLPAVQYLRWRGYVIDRHGISLASRGVRVGNKIITFAALREMAARERRLAEVPVVVAPRRKAGRARA